MKGILLKVELICAPNTPNREIAAMTTELAERLERFSYVNRVEAFELKPGEVKRSGAFIHYIDSNGHLASDPVIGAPRRFRCHGCSLGCKTSTFNEQPPNCCKDDPHCNWVEEDAQ